MAVRIKIIICIAWFLLLYLIAFFSVRDYYKDFPHFLGVEDTQWAVILTYSFAMLIIFFA